MGKPQRKRKRRTHVPDENVHGSLDPSKKRPPRALVLRTGKHTKVVKKLEKDLKLCMRPHTADKLKQRKGNVMKDFLNVVGPLGISHFLVLSATERCQYLKVAKTPQGPTATFRIEKWSSSADFASAMKRYTAPVGAFKYSPLLVLSGFKNADRHDKLCATLFQNMFPTMEVNKLKISNCQRVVMVHYSREENSIQFRHYSINQQPAGVSKSVRDILRRELPELGHLQDISQYLQGEAEAMAGGRGDGDGRSSGSESEGEDEDNTVEGAQTSDRVRGGAGTKKNVVKLREIGPRLELSLVKIEEGVCDGKVLYHAYVSKTAEEEEEQENKRKKAADLKRSRREAQDANVQRKREG